MLENWKSYQYRGSFVLNDLQFSQQSDTGISLLNLVVRELDSLADTQIDGHLLVIW